MLERVLDDNTQEAVDRVAHLLLEDKLSYSTKHHGPIRWLQSLYETEKIMEKDGRCRTNLIWHFATGSFVGCIHSLRTGAVGTLLSWVKEKLPFEEIRRKWSALADPLSYMRPVAAPKSSNILVAEKLFAELQLTKDDMRRVFLTPDQIPDPAFLYRAPLPSPQQSGIFSTVTPREKHVRRAESELTDIDNIPPTALTFAKFARDVLPTAQK